MLENYHSNAVEKIGSIPVQNIWILFLYASDLASFKGRFQSEVESSPTIYDLVARLLCHILERRLKKNLNQTFLPNASILTRVRGKIDHLKTARNQLMQKGQVFCKYEHLTVNTPQNRLLRTALGRLTFKVKDKAITSRCKYFYHHLSILGVDDKPILDHEVDAIHISRSNKEDRLAFELSKLVFSIRLPSRNLGKSEFSDVDTSAYLVRRLFEKAIRNFYKLELSSKDGWVTYPTEKHLRWPIEKSSKLIDEIMPIMRADIIIDNKKTGERTIIDTKFANIFGRSLHREKSLKSQYIYQIYCYLRTQEDVTEVGSKKAQGLLLHPSVHEQVDEYIELQGHKIRFVTINLAQPSAGLMRDLKKVMLA